MTHFRLNETKSFADELVGWIRWRLRCVLTPKSDTTASSPIRSGADRSRCPQQTCTNAIFRIDKDNPTRSGCSLVSALWCHMPFRAGSAAARWTLFRQATTRHERNTPWRLPIPRMFAEQAAMNLATAADTPATTFLAPPLGARPRTKRVSNRVARSEKVAETLGFQLTPLQQAS